MRLTLSAERRQFGASLHDLLAHTDVAAATAAWARGNHTTGLSLWRRLADLGVTGLAVPRRWGGLGAHPLDIVVACEELGHHALPGPVAETVAAVPTMLCEVDDELAGRWLPDLADGTLIATLAAPPWLPYAVDADAAGLVLLADDGRLCHGVPETGWPSVDETRRLFAVRAGTVLAVGPGAARARARALDMGALACAAQLLGAGRALLEETTGYVRRRSQFGRPVGQFQAVKHRLADVAIALEFARPLLHAAAVTMARHAPTAARDTSAAKVACAGAADRAARAALQLHGAIGYTAEYGIGRWLTKIRALLPAWGTQSEHRARLMSALLEQGGRTWT